MNINTTVADKELETAKLIESNIHGDYYYINAQILIEIKTPSFTHYTTLQNGHDYIGGDYSCPSNSMTVYESTENDLIKTLWVMGEDEVLGLSAEETQDINETHDTNYSINDLHDIYEAIRDAIFEADQEVIAATHEAETHSN